MRSRPEYCSGLVPYALNVGIDGAEPGVGIGDVDHEDTHTCRPCPLRRLDAPRGVGKQASIPASRRRPVFDDLHAQLEIAIQQAKRLTIRLIAGHLVNGTIEQEPLVESLAQRGNVVGRTHGHGLDYAEFLGGFEHQFGRGSAPPRPRTAWRPRGRIAGPGDGDMGVTIDERSGVDEMPALAIILAGQVMFRMRAHVFSSARKYIQFRKRGNLRRTSPERNFKTCVPGW